MPTGVAQVADYDILPGPLYLRALRRDRNGGSTEEIDWCEDIQEVHAANHNGSNSASWNEWCVSIRVAIHARQCWTPMGSCLVIGADANTFGASSSAESRETGATAQQPGFSR